MREGKYMRNKKLKKKKKERKRRNILTMKQEQVTTKTDIQRAEKNS